MAEHFIDLATCRPGQRLRTRNDEILTFLGKDATASRVALTPYLARVDYGQVVKYDYGRYGGYSLTGVADPRDIVEILPDKMEASPQTVSAPAVDVRPATPPYLVVELVEDSDANSAYCDTYRWTLRDGDHVAAGSANTLREAFDQISQTGFPRDAREERDLQRKTVAVKSAAEELRLHKTSLEGDLVDSLNTFQELTGLTVEGISLTACSSLGGSSKIATADVEVSL